MTALEKLFQTLLLLLIFVMPSQWGSPFPPVGKPFLFVSYGDIVLGVAFLVWLVLFAVRRDWKAFRLPPLSLLAFAALVVIAVGFAEGKKGAIKEAIQSLEFFVVAGLLFLSGFRTPQQWHRAFLVFAISVAGTVLLALTQYFTAGNAYDIAGAFGNKNVLASFLAVALPFVLGHALHETRRGLQCVLLVLLIPGLLVTLSGGAVIALVLASLIVASLRGRGALAVTLVVWACLFALAPRLYLRAGHGQILHSSIASFLRSNYTYGPAAAAQQAQRILNEGAGYDAARDFLAVYEDLHRGRPDLQDSPLFTSDDARVFTLDDAWRWEEFCTQIHDGKDRTGPSEKLWGRMSAPTRDCITRTAEMTEDDDKAKHKLAKACRERAVALLNSIVRDAGPFETSDFEGVDLDDEIRELLATDHQALEPRAAMMRNRRLLVALYPDALVLPVRMRLTKMIDGANARTEKKLKELREQLGSVPILKKADTSAGESLLQEMAEGHVSSLEERELHFQLTELPEPVPNTRYIRWQAAWKLIRSNRAAGLIGVGPGNFLAGINRNYETGGPLRKPSAEGRGGAPDTWGLAASEPDSFNQYLVYAAELGFLGLLAFIWILIDGLSRAGMAVRNSSPAARGLGLGALGALIGAMVVSVFHPVVIRGLGLPLVFILCAASFAHRRAEEGASGNDQSAAVPDPAETPEPDEIGPEPERDPE